MLPQALFQEKNPGFADSVSPGLPFVSFTNPQIT